MTNRLTFILLACSLVLSVDNILAENIRLPPFPRANIPPPGVDRHAPHPPKPTPAPLVRPFGDNKYWITSEDVRYIIGSTNQSIVIPRGFVTDFASIPQSLWSLGLSPHGQYSRAAVIHDYLYWSQGCTRAQADRLLVIAMKESLVKTFDEFVVYQGVSRGGKRSWINNGKERQTGLPRIVPQKYLHPDDPNVTWPKYRAMLIKEGIQDPPFETNPTYCVLGNSTKVP